MRIKVICRKIESITSRGSIELGDTDTTFSVSLNDIENEKEIFESLRSEGYGNQDVDALKEENDRLRLMIDNGLGWEDMKQDV